MIPGAAAAILELKRETGSQRSWPRALTTFSFKANSGTLSDALLCKKNKPLLLKLLLVGYFVNLQPRSPTRPPHALVAAPSGFVIRAYPLACFSPQTVTSHTGCPTPHTRSSTQGTYDKSRPTATKTHRRGSGPRPPDEAKVEGSKGRAPGITGAKYRTTHPRSHCCRSPITARIRLPSIPWATGPLEWAGRGSFASGPYFPEGTAGPRGSGASGFLRLGRRLSSRRPGGGGPMRRLCAILRQSDCRVWGRAGGPSGPQRGSSLANTVRRAVRWGSRELVFLK